MRMLAAPGFVSEGEIHLNALGDTDILSLSEEEMRRVRLRKISYIPQGRDELVEPGDAGRDPDLGRQFSPMRRA